MVLKKRYKSLLVELTLFTLFIFFFYDIIWMIIDFDNFYNLLTTSMDTFLLNFLIDLFYCVVFASINITSKNVIFNNKFRRRNSNGSLKFEITAKRLYAASQRVL